VSAEPEVSICIVTFRDRDNVLRCLETIAEHADLPHEVVVVDDASDDGTAGAVSTRFPDVRLIARTHNGGLVAGRNDALPHLRGQFVLMLDSDTEMRPGALSTLAQALRAQPTLGLAGPRLMPPSGELQMSCRRYPPFLIPFLRRGPYARLNPSPRVHRRHLMMDFDHASERPVAWVSGAAQMWRGELARQLGSYDRRLSSYGGEDIDWCLRIWEAGLEVHYVPDAEIVHHWQQVTRRNTYGRSSLRALRDWYYLQWKHRRLRSDPRMAAANA
jgi:GT2 family glycosyltransferase